MKVLKISIKDYCLDLLQLSNVISEFYGNLLEDAKVNLDKGVLEFEFEENEHADEASAALLCFKNKKGK